MVIPHVVPDDCPGQTLSRRMTAPHLVALVRAGAVLRDGVPIKRPETAAA
jgi:hypothetical protein